MNIIYLITFYEIGDGSSSAVRTQVQIDKDVYKDYLIITKKTKTSENGLKITSIDDTERINNFIVKGDLCIHYFKARSSNLLMDVLNMVGKDVPVISTVCQCPSSKNLWLTPFELNNTWHFVFIDKASDNNSLVSFIPQDAKSQIYMAGYASKQIFPSKKEFDNGGKIIYGRGSSSIKCPKTMFDVFDKIDIPNKVFRIVGIDGDSWIKEEAKKRDNVEVYGKLDVEEWKKICDTFDVFLYQLPDDCFASIDGTLGLAMLLEKPVVYMGPNAPKERFHNNENGFVANSIDEMAHYATLLGRDSDLRRKIGKKGRISTINDFRVEDRIVKYKDIYRTIHERKTKLKIPIKYILQFYTKNRKQANQYICGRLRFRFGLIYSLYLKIKTANS